MENVMWEGSDRLYNSENIFPGFSIDCVILSLHKKKIKVLLRKFDMENYWALLGGFMFKDEEANEAAYRILRTYIGLENIFLKQFQLFSEPNRNMMPQDVDVAYKNILTKKSVEWLEKRFISMGYFALVKYEEVSLPPHLKSKLKWFDIENLPNLYADHNNIIDTAIGCIRSMLPAMPIGYELLPEKFTMTELRRIYEIILGKTLDRRNFHRKVLSEGNIIQLNEKRDNKEYNPASLFSFKKENIESLKSDNTGPII